LPFFRRDTSNDPDTPFTWFLKTPVYKSEISRSIWDHVDAVGGYPIPQRLGDAVAARNGNPTRSAQSESSQVSRAPLSDSMMGVEQNRKKSPRSQCRRDQQ
jgi:hypothetical protein